MAKRDAMTEFLLWHCQIERLCADCTAHNLPASAPFQLSPCLLQLCADLRRSARYRLPFAKALAHSLPIVTSTQSMATRAEVVYKKGMSAGKFEYEYRIVRPGGSVRWIEAKGFPVRDHAGKCND